MRDFRSDNAAFVAGILAKHYRISGYLTAFHERQSRSFGYVEANRKLRELNDALIFDSYQSAAIDEDAICNLSKVRSEHCENIYKSAAVNGDLDYVREKLEHYCEYNGVSFPLKIGKKDSSSLIAKKIIAASARVSCHKWWRRQLRKVTGRCVEAVLRSIGGVQAGKSPYISNYNFERWKQAQKRNADMLDSMDAITEIDGEEVAVSLSECVASSISNPVNRRNELMVRMRGYEEVATGMGFSGLFLTLTAPSKYHAINHGRGINPKFCGANPIDVMNYMNSVWARIRAEWARAGIKCFGFRVAEPHHDGTPHFHLMLFMSVDVIEKAKSIFAAYALDEDGEEAGADRNRWDAVVIDPSKGSASGYIAKYVAKNIDGFGVDVDEDGQCQAGDGALRARAWASMWGIRQFQPVGSVSVTVWRELRRNCEIFEDPDLDIDEIRAAADAADWAKFVELMGGALVKRNEQTLRPLYQNAEQFDNAYGEEVKKMIGLWLLPVGRAIARCAFITRDRVWTVRRREAPKLGSGEAAT